MGVPSTKVKQSFMPAAVVRSCRRRTASVANPATKGQQSTLEKFPPYLPHPPKELKRKKPVEGEEEERLGFKATYKGLSRPTPSIATNIRNLKSSYPMAFRK